MLPTFAPLHEFPSIGAAWPTPNQTLFSEPERFFARTRANPNYGKPGLTRDCGERLHRGCDIAPINQTPTGKTICMRFTDCSTKKEYESEEPTFIPHDPVFALFEDIVITAETDQTKSTYGKHVMIEHRWPNTSARFFTCYAHLDSLEITTGSRVDKAKPIGVMGRTSSSEDACRWLSIAPHLHIEVLNENREHVDPVEFFTEHRERTD